MPHSQGHAKPSTMQDEPDEVLFLYMAYREGSAADKKLADEAFEEVHRRYMQALYRRCQRYSNLLDALNIGPDNLAAVALYRAYERAEKFPDMASSEKGGVAQTLNWLAEIALNVLLDHLKNPKNPHSPLGTVPEDPLETASYLCTDDFITVYLDANPVAAGDASLIAEAYDQLDDRTRQVLQYTLAARSYTPNGKQMFRGLGQEAAKRMGLTPDNFRKIRSKGMNEIAKYVRDHRKD